jgi:hypothetical protein
MLDRVLCVWIEIMFLYIFVTPFGTFSPNPVIVDYSDYGDNIDYGDYIDEIAI